MSAFASPVALRIQPAQCSFRACKTRMSAKNPEEDERESQPLALNDTEKRPAPRVSRRTILRLVSGAGALGTLGFTYRMRESLRYMSPAAFLSELGVRPAPLRAATGSSAVTDSTRDFIARRDQARDMLCPDFPSGADWVNSRPLSLRSELAGKVVLLDFFTYCCVNCMHALPRLAKLERVHGGDGARGFAVVGVHSAKFAAERDSANVAAAVSRYGVAHPVINDSTMSLWGALGVSSWPTLALVGPRGNLLAMWTGEAAFDDLDSVVTAALDYYSTDLDRTPLPAAPPVAVSSALAQSPLRYPGKLALAPDGTALYVADSANHRVLELMLEPEGGAARIARVFGTGTAGFDDGTNASFRSPQGVAMATNALYVADTGNHAVRAVDLASGTVRTLGGDGTRGTDYRPARFGRAQPMASPWDLLVSGGNLYVAMAGTHQLWRLPLDAGRDASWDVLSGTGRESEYNAGDARRAAWAQPSGLSVAGKELFVADSESSTVRAVALDGGGTRTLAGGDGAIADNLFAFGDRDGRGRAARFQHPLAVAHDARRGVTYVADSYNHRIKVVDSRGTATSLCGDGKPGFRDGIARAARFWEPAGLALAPDASSLFVADTNNAAVRVIDLATRAVATLKIIDPARAAEITERGPLVANRARATVSEVEGSVGPSSVLRFDIHLPEATHFTPGATSLFQGSFVRGAPGTPGAQYEIVQSGSVSADAKANQGTFSVDLSKATAQASSKDAIVEVESVFYYCGDVDGVCRTDSQVFQFTVDGSGAGREVSIDRTIVPKRRRPVSLDRSQSGNL